VRRIFALFALAAGLSIPAAGAPSAVADEHAAPPGLGIRLVDVPVTAADDPRARVYIIDHVKPGSLLERRVQVVNKTGHAADIALYSAAAEVREGSFAGLEGRTENELSSWTTVTPSVARLGSGEQTFANVAIKVPSEASRDERYAAVWAETTTPPSVPGGITQVSRVGVRIYLSVGLGGEPASDFVIQSFTAERDDAGVPLVEVTARNTGGRALDLSGQLRLTDGPGGLSAGPFDMELGTTLGIGETEPVTVALGQELPDGPWTANVTMRSGLLIRTARATLTFPAGPGAAESVTTDAADAAISPWLLVVGAAVALAALFGLVVAWRRRERECSSGS